MWSSMCCVNEVVLALEYETENASVKNNQLHRLTSPSSRQQVSYGISVTAKGIEELVIFIS